MKFVEIPWRNLHRRPLRSGFTVLGITVAVASFIALVGLSRGLEQAWINNLVERGIHMLALRKGVVELLTAAMDEGLAEELGQIEGVREASGELANLLRLESGDNVLVKGWPLGSYLWETLRLREGKFPEAGELKGIVIGQALAEARDKQPGDEISLYGHKFEVSGVSAPAGMLSNSSVFLPLSALQELLERPGQVTDFALRLDHPEDPAAVAAVQSRLAEKFPELSFIETSDVADNNEILRIFRAMAWGTSTIALVIALIVVLNTLLMSVTERTREIGVLSAVGWQPGRVLAMIVTEGLILAAVGSTLGSVLGLTSLSWLIRLPSLHGLSEPEITSRLLLEVSGTALFLGVVGSLYPAWRAVNLNPVEALKYE